VLNFKHEAIIYAAAVALIPTMDGVIPLAPLAEREVFCMEKGVGFPELKSKTEAVIRGGVIFIKKRSQRRGTRLPQGCYIWSPYEPGK
jgi:hypothetical protein